MLNFITKVTMVVLLPLTLLSCASTTHIQVIDTTKQKPEKDVRIYVDGQYKGIGSAHYSDTKIIGSTTQIELRKKGCESQSQTMSRTEKVNVGVLIGGLFFAWPLWLWVMDYNPSRTYEFQCH